MKNILFSLCLALCALHAIGQTTLPTSWDFSSTPASLPTGWSTNTTANYSSGLIDNNGSTSVAAKLQVTDHYVTIHFFDEPGTVTYNLKSYGTPSFMGTLEVQESVNGTSWSTMHTFNSGDFNDSWSLFSETPNIASRYIRFILSNKISGTNAGLDDVSILANVPTIQEMNVQFEGNDVPNNSAVQFAESLGSTKVLKFGIQNLGTGSSLSIGASNLTGIAAGDFAVASSPSNIGTLSSDTLEINFTPSAAGSRAATLTIVNDDPNENPYVINLNGIGGTGASEPIANPSNLSVGTIKTFRVSASFDASVAEGFVVLFKKNAPINATLIDGVAYEVGQGLGNAKVAYVGPNNSFWLNEASADDTFHIEVYAYNGTGQFINYKNDAPLQGEIITPLATMINANYYNGIDAHQSTFLEDLHDVINPHTIRFYSNYKSDIVPQFIARDTINNQRVVTCVYSNDQVVYSPPFAWTPTTSLNREHTLPASWMPSAGNTGTAEYQDRHHLYPSVSTANGQRSNEPLGEVVTITSSYGEGKRGTDAFGNTVYEPKEGQKGDAARAIFYMMAAYNNAQTDNWAFDNLLSNGPNQRQDVLVNWHLNDLPSGYEHARNHYIDSLQGNRNPFVDSAQWVCYIDFKTMSYRSNPDSTCLVMTAGSNPLPVDTTDSTIGIKPFNTDDNWIMYPNPAVDFVTIGNKDFATILSMFDTQGRMVLFRTLSSVETIDVREIPSSIYLINLQSTLNKQRQNFRLIKE